MNILIWGTGKVADELISKLDKIEFNIIGFIESTKSKDFFMEKPVYEAKSLVTMKLNYEFIIVASSLAKEIRNLCIELKIDMSKFVWIRLEKNIDNNVLYNTYEIENTIPGFGQTYCSEFDKEKILIQGKLNSNEEYKKNYEEDYIRFKMFDLVTNEIDDSLEGDVAELGVFQGEFAKHINRKFFSRKLYLFDTFSGFNEEEAIYETTAGNCDQSFVSFFSQGSEEITLNKMKHIDNCIIKKGYFPDSLDGLESKFVFVSIDVDFEKSIYEGLKYFYPRLVKGGYIFIHDYNYYLKGVRKAVLSYEKEFGKLCKVPIADNCGTLIITK